jgi:hypothetical protein
MKNYLFRISFCCFFFFSTYSISHGQAALIALLFGDKVTTEKFHLSVDLGMNFSSMPGLLQQSGSNGFYFGLGTFIKLNDKFTLNPEFKPLSPRGASNVWPITDYSQVLSGTEYGIKLNYIDIPVLLQYRINEKLFASAGPQVSFLTAASQVASGNLPSGNSVELKEPMKSNFESVYFSIPLELGYTLADARKGKGMDIKMRYNIGISNMVALSSYESSTGSTFQVFLSFPFVNDEN